MSIVIVGGHERMVRQYENLCKEYDCQAKVCVKKNSGFKQIGSPDLLVLFTSTVSHTMVKCALNEVKGEKTTVARSQSSSLSALRNILEEHVS